MSAPDVISLPGLIWGAVRRPARELWRSLREGDQAAMIGLLMQVAARARDPDAFYVDGRPFAPRILVVHSAAGLKAMASEPAIDKGPTASIAVAIGGDTDAYEPIMGQATSRSYQPQIGLVHAIIKQRQRGLRELVERRFDAHLAPPREVGLRAVQYYTASILLQTIFPAHEWSREEIVSLIDALEENALVVGPMAQNAALRGEAVSEILRSAAIRDAAGRYDALYARLAREEQLRQAELALPTDPTAESERQRLRGVATMFADAGLRWPDTKALATTLFSASYETVATSINEPFYQLARHPELWAELRRQQRRRAQAAHQARHLRGGAHHQSAAHAPASGGARVHPADHPQRRQRPRLGGAGEAAAPRPHPAAA